MMFAWQTVFEAALEEGASRNDARRVANLLLAAILTTAGKTDVDAIVALAHTLHLPPGLESALDPSTWRRLAERAAVAQSASSSVPARIDYDGWVRAFQCADTSRKELGAYATPAAFADALADAAINAESDERRVRILLAVPGHC